MHIYIYIIERDTLILIIFIMIKIIIIVDSHGLRQGGLATVAPSKPRGPLIGKGKSGKDKGGPSKGGFLNNRLFSYTVLYLCDEINGMYKHNILFMKMIHCSGNHLY